MNAEKSIYIKCNNYLFSKTCLLWVLITSSGVYSISYLLKFHQIISDTNIYFTSIGCFLFAALRLYLQKLKPPHHYILINNEEISFKHNKKEEEIRLRFEAIEYFETRFSQIVFSTKDHEKVILQLNRIANEKKRWEIKEFLRGRVKQANTNLALA